MQVSLMEEDVGASLHLVGQLDKDTTGLLLLSNNGELTDMILRPALISKTYIGTSRLPR
jgi:16S rRNA U516 pseudouridylate synthase RsuA-like enzyme